MQARKHHKAFAYDTLGWVIAALLTISVSIRANSVPNQWGNGYAPSITIQPTSQTVNAGQTATFYVGTSVGARGATSLKYQWQKNGSAISGATSSSYTTPATKAADNGSVFKVIVSDRFGGATSNRATLTVNTPAIALSITAQPVSQTVTAGHTATFSVAVTGTAPLNYQWTKNSGIISGANSASYTTPATTLNDNHALFAVTISNSGGSVTSRTATLNVNAPPPNVVAPSITAQPVSQTVTAGQTATFSVGVTGTAPFSYQWKQNGVSVSGATSASYATVASISGNHGSLFSVTISNQAGSVTSSTATLNVNAPPPNVIPPSITTQPVSQTVTAGQTATFSVAVTGTAPLRYQWYKNGTTISGATSSSYTTPATTATGSGSLFFVIISNSAGSATSNNATLTINSALVSSLTANPSGLAFGNINTNISSTLQTTLTNSGNASVTIFNVSVSGAGFGASGISTGQVLTPGQTATLVATFAPASANSVAGSVTITSNATNSPMTISLSGTGVQTVSHEVTLSWTASTSAVVGYNVYRTSVSGGSFTKLTPAYVPTTGYVDSTVQAGDTYYYAVTSVNSSGMESIYSSTISATVP